MAFSLRCPNDKPNIEIGFSESPDSGPRIETWDDTLVLSSGNRFAPILKLTENSRELQLRIFWDRIKREAKVCDADGKTLAEMANITAPPKPRTGKRSNSSTYRDPGRLGFRLLNRTTSLEFDRLAVREWDGRTIPKFDSSKPRLEMVGGRALFDLANLEMSPNRYLRLNGKNVDLSQVDQLIFSTSRKEQLNSEDYIIAWNDGSLVSGAVGEIRKESATLQPRWLDKPLEARFENAQSFQFPESDIAVEEAPDRLKSEDVDIGGRLTPGDNSAPNALLAWQLVGAENSASLVSDRPGDVTRGSWPGATDMIGDSRIYLVNNEVIVGKLLSIDEENVKFDSYITGQVVVPNTMVRAIDIEGAGLLTDGFNDEGWVTLQEENADPEFEAEAGKDQEEKDVVIMPEKVVLRKGGFGHMNLMVGNRIKFHTKWESNYGVFTLRLFCSDFSKSSPSTDLLIGAQGNRILVGQIKPGGGFTFSGDQINIKDQQADIEILADQNEIEVFVNGKQSMSMTINPSRISGNGIAFRMGGGWRGWDATANSVEISNFSIDRTAGFLPKRIINPIAKRHALAIPRVHRENPPTHVLVASNGDLLRGKLKSARGEKVYFTSRDSDMEIPRSRVSAIIWLQENQLDEDSVDRSFPITHQFILNDGSRLNLKGGETKIREEVFVGESEILGECRLPLHTFKTQSQGYAHPLSRPAKADELAYADWVTTNTPDPNIPKGDGSGDHPMIGKKAPEFTIPLLGGNREFKLSQRKGRVVVLDFWATWCGPCIKAMPEVFHGLSPFKSQPVDFCAVNQGETSPLITEFLENRGWQNTVVGLDYDLTVGRDFEVKGIPHTVVIGRDGNIAWVHTGYDPDLSSKLAKAIAAALKKNQ